MVTIGQIAVLVWSSYVSAYNALVTIVREYTKAKVIIIIINHLLSITI